MIDAHQFSAYLALQGKADATIRNYRALYMRWCDWATGRGHDPHRPDPLAVRAWAAQLHGSRETIAQARAVIGHLCDALEQPQVKTVIPLPRKPRRGRRGLRRPVAVKLARQARISGLPGTAVLVGMFTAARVSEIACLEWDRIDFNQQQVTLWRPKTRDWHTVPMNSALAAHLEERRTGERWVFPGRYGGHLSPARIREWVAEVAEAAGIDKVTPHQLRHTAITEAYDRSKDLRAAQDLAGHTDPAQTATYTWTSEDAAIAAVESLDWFGDDAA